MKCPICDNNNLNRKYKLKNRNVYECSVCGLEMLVNEQPFFYNADYYRKNYFSEGFQDQNFYIKITEELQLSQDEAVLDVGCGRGEYLFYLAKNHPRVRKAANDLHNILPDKNIAEKFFEGDFLKIDIKDYFNVVTMWDLFEHVDNPMVLLEKAKSLLKKNGKIFIYTVSSDCLLRKIGHVFYRLGFNKFIEKLYPPYHLFYFNAKNLRKICAKLELDVAGLGYKYYDPKRMEAAYCYKCAIKLIYLMESFFSKKKTNIYFIAIKK